MKDVVLTAEEQGLWTVVAQLRNQLREAEQTARREVKLVNTGFDTSYDAFVCCPYCDSRDLHYEEDIPEVREVRGVKSGEAYIDAASRVLDGAEGIDERIWCRECLMESKLPEDMPTEWGFDTMTPYKDRLDTLSNADLDTLETLIDRYGLTVTLEGLAEVASTKADHIRETWNDTPLAAAWDRLAAHLLRAISAIVTTRKPSPPRIRRLRP